jgi:hypothetical protein
VGSVDTSTAANASTQHGKPGRCWFGEVGSKYVEMVRSGRDFVLASIVRAGWWGAVRGRESLPWQLRVPGRATRVGRGEAKVGGAH